jgi:hypothetical protein
MLRSLLPRLGDFLFVCVFSGCMLIGQRMLNVDGDLGRHLTLGTYIIESRNIPVRDVLSFSMTAQSRPPYEWLAQAAFAIANLMLGLDGVVLLTAAIIAAASVMVYLDARERSGAALVSLGLASWAAAASSLHWLTRPHIFSFLFLALWLRLLERLRLGQPRSGWQLALVMLAWANSHGAFIVGFLAWTAYFAGWVVERQRHKGSPEIGPRLLLVGVTSLAASMITPAPWQNWAAVLRNRSDYVLSRTAETLPVDFSTLSSWPFLGLLVLGLLLALLNRKRIAPAHAFLLMGSSAAGVAMARNIPLFCIAAAPVLATWAWQVLEQRARFTQLDRRISQMDSGLRRSVWPPLAILVAVALLINNTATTERSFFDFNPTIFPVHAADWVERHPLKGNVLNDLNWGGYLLYRLWPSQRVFIDSQTDFYGEAFIRQYAALVEGDAGWEARLKENGVTWVVLPPLVPLAHELRLEPGWRVAFEDSTAVIFVREDT